MLLALVAIATLADGGRRCGRGRRLRPGDAALAERPPHAHGVLRDPRIHRCDLRDRRGRARRVHRQVPVAHERPHGRGRASARAHTAGDHLDRHPGLDPLRHRDRRLRRAAEHLECSGGGEPTPRHGRRPPVLLAVRLSERRALDQRSVRAGRPRRRPEDRFLRRRAQLVDPRARREDPGAPGHHEPHVVPGRQGGDVRRPVRRTVRPLPRGDGGARDRHGATPRSRRTSAPRARISARPSSPACARPATA